MLNLLNLMRYSYIYNFEFELNKKTAQYKFQSENLLIIKIFIS